MEPELRTDHGFQKDYDTYVDMVFHICLVYMKNKQDAEDMLQDTFVKLLKRENGFVKEKVRR